MTSLATNHRINSAFSKAQNASWSKSSNPNTQISQLPKSKSQQVPKDNSWDLADQAKKLLSHTPGYLLHIPVIKNYILKSRIMPWVFRDPNVEKFDPEIFRNRGYEVTRIAPNEMIQGEKYLILPKTNNPNAEAEIIIHGARTSARSLGGNVQAALEAGHPVIIGDIVGFGSQDGSFNIETIQKDIEGLINFTHNKFQKPFSILAHSFGTYNAVVALTRAMESNPEIKTKKLILISPWASFHKVAKGLWETDKKHNTGRPRIESLLHEVKDPYAKNAIASLSESHLDLVKDLAETAKVFEKAQDLKERMGEISIFWGTEDEHIAPIHSQNLAKELRKLGFQTKETKMVGIGHSDATSKNTTNIAKRILDTARSPYQNSPYSIAA